MPRIPDPTLINAPDPEPTSVMPETWNDPAPAPVPPTAFTHPPREQWPTYEPKPERVVPAREDWESDTQFASREYSYAVFWSKEDAKLAQQPPPAAPRSRVDPELRRARNTKAVAEHRARKRQAELQAMGEQERAWATECDAIDVYVQNLESQMQALRDQRTVALARKRELHAAIAGSVGARARK